MHPGTGTKRRVLAVSILALVALAVGCREVGRGDLHVQNDLSGIGRDNTISARTLPSRATPGHPRASSACTYGETTSEVHRPTA